MVTSREEFFASMLAATQGGEIPTIAHLLPKSETIYNIDMNSRTIETPEYLSVRFDHNSETIFFIIDRFFDNQDLSETCCVVQYTNALGEGRFYVVPYYDIETFRKTKKMIIPWCIEGEATKAEGDVTYSFRFFKTDSTKKKITYNLNTLTTKSKVLNGMNILGYYEVDVNEETYKPNTFYVRNSAGNYEKSQLPFNPKEQYYSISDRYNQETDTLLSIWDRLSKLENGSKLYWYTVEES